MATMIDRDMAIERITALMEMCEDIDAQFRRDQYYLGAASAQAQVHILSRPRADILRLPIITTE